MGHAYPTYDSKGSIDKVKKYATAEEVAAASTSYSGYAGVDNYEYADVYGQLNYTEKSCMDKGKKHSSSKDIDKKHSSSSKKKH